MCSVWWRWNESVSVFKIKLNRGILLYRLIWTCTPKFALRVCSFEDYFKKILNVSYFWTKISKNDRRRNEMNAEKYEIYIGVDERKKHRMETWMRQGSGRAKKNESWTVSERERESVEERKSGIVTIKSLKMSSKKSSFDLFTIG